MKLTAGIENVGTANSGGRRRSDSALKLRGSASRRDSIRASKPQQPDWYELPDGGYKRQVYGSNSITAAGVTRLARLLARARLTGSMKDSLANPQSKALRMFEWKVDGRSFCIRDVQSESEFHTIEDIQKEAWGFSDLDTVPAATLMATQHAGGVLLGAFEGDAMIGFAYGFAAYDGGRASIHSHMLAVRPDFRNFQAGFRLKLAQRERVLEKGLDEISWTYDPLQSLNAHLNFAKLGVISQRYIVNFYGEATSSPLHQGFGTDRLWVRWLLNTERVMALTSKHPHSSAASNSDSDLDMSSSIKVALVTREGDEPGDGDFSRLSGDRCTIEIPYNINALKERDPQAGIAWRNATRKAFLAAIDAGFEVTNFLRVGSNTNPRWFYLLTRG